MGEHDIADWDCAKLQGEVLDENDHDGYVMKQGYEGDVAVAPAAVADAAAGAGDHRRRMKT